MRKRFGIQGMTALLALAMVFSFRADTHGYRELFNRINAHLSPAQDHYVASTYAMYRDSLGGSAVQKLQVEKWKAGASEVIKTGLMDIYREANRQLIVDYESRIIALGPLSGNMDWTRGYAVYLDSMLSRCHLKVLQNTASTSTLQVNYPPRVPISASLLVYDHNTYVPKRATIFSKVPQAISQDDWAISPRIEISYDLIEIREVKLPDDMGKYLEEVDGEYILKERYQDFEFLNQLND